MADKTEALVGEFFEYDTEEERVNKWCDFVKEHGYVFTSDSDYDDYARFLESRIIPAAMILGDPTTYDEFNKVNDYPANFADPELQFLKDGGRFINDIYGIEPNSYVDTSDNRDIIMKFLERHPDAIITNWINESKYSLDKYNALFNDAHNCHFFAELKLDKETYELSGMSGSESETLGYGKDDIIPSTIDFPNGVSIQFNVLVEEDNCMNSCEALVLEDGEFKGDSYDGNSLLGIWELEDDNGNTYHVKVSPPELVKEKVDSIDKEETQEMGKEFHVDLYASSAKEDKMIEDLIDMTGDEAYDKYEMNRDETITHTAKFNDGIEVDIKLCIAEGDNYNWCEAVIFKNGSEIGCSDVSEEFFGPWKLEDHEGNKYCVDMHPHRDLVRQKEESVKVSGSVPKLSKKVQPNLGR